MSSEFKSLFENRFKDNKLINGSKKEPGNGARSTKRRNSVYSNKGSLRIRTIGATR
jgi:hypothetical protein